MGRTHRKGSAMLAPRLHFEFLEEEMTRQSITLTDLSARSGIPDSTLSRIFHDQVGEPRASQVLAIANALGLDFHAVMRRAGLPIPDPAAPNAETLRQAAALETDPELAGFLRVAEQLRPADRDVVRAYMLFLEQQRAARQAAARNTPQSAEEDQ